MKYFDEFITEEEIENIQKVDCLYSVDTISLNDRKKRKMLDSYAYQNYLKEINSESSDFDEE